MKIALLTTTLFGTPGHGGEICSARLLDALRSAGHEVTLVGRGDAHAAQVWCRHAVACGAAVQPFATLPVWWQVWSLLTAIATGRASSVHRQSVPWARLRDTLFPGGEPTPFDLWIVDHLQPWSWLGAPPRGRAAAPTMLIAHNVESDIYSAQARREPGLRRLARRCVLEREARHVLALERRALREATAVATISADDEERLRTLAGARAPGFVPLNLYPLQAWQVPAMPPPGERVIGLIGTWTWAPNRAALLWFLQSVLPLLPPRCRVLLAGSGLEDLALPARVRSLGRVPRVEDFYGGVHVVAIPSLFGSGVQEKAIEAIGSGIAVVASPHALRGLGEGLPPNVAAADSAKAFAGACAAPPTPAPAAARAWAQARRTAYREALATALARLAPQPANEYTAQVAVVLLNWNGWRDTIACLDALRRQEGAAAQGLDLIVCDNGSGDGSPRHIDAWARAHNKPLTLLEIGSNLGFAGGCNVGIRHALARPGCTHVWLLNNDAVPTPGALVALLRHLAAHPRVGLCGSQIRCHDRPGTVQSFGGYHNRWLGRTRAWGAGLSGDALRAPPMPIDFVPGASVLATRAFVEQVGLMHEGYFLYFEELDWAQRARGRFELAVCADSIVLHKGGASIGTPHERGDRGERAEFFEFRGRLRFAARHQPALLPLVALGLVAALVKRVLLLRWAGARTVACALMGIEPSAVRALRTGGSS